MPSSQSPAGEKTRRQAGGSCRKPHSSAFPGGSSCLTGCNSPRPEEPQMEAAGGLSVDHPKTWALGGSRKGSLRVPTTGLPRYIQVSPGPCQSIRVSLSLLLAMEPWHRSFTSGPWWARPGPPTPSHRSQPKPVASERCPGPPLPSPAAPLLEPGALGIAALLFLASVTSGGSSGLRVACGLFPLEAIGLTGKGRHDR